MPPYSGMILFLMIAVFVVTVFILGIERDARARAKRGRLHDYACAALTGMLSYNHNLTHRTIEDAWSVAYEMGCEGEHREEKARQIKKHGEWNL